MFSFHLFSQMKCNPNLNKSLCLRDGALSLLWFVDFRNDTPAAPGCGSCMSHGHSGCGPQPLGGPQWLRIGVPPPHCTPDPQALVCPSQVQGGCRAGTGWSAEQGRGRVGALWGQSGSGVLLLPPPRPCPGPCSQLPAHQSLSCHIPTFLLFLP